MQAAPSVSLGQQSLLLANFTPSGRAVIFSISKPPASFMPTTARFDAIVEVDAVGESSLELSEVRSSLVHAQPLSGSLAGISALGHRTPGPALIHELGHSAVHFAGFPIGTPSLGRSTNMNFSEALRYENLHGKLLKGHREFQEVES